jgi:NAD(P)-dependent dehydrogenase (short-subunit alcohol dehydrogenase family)
MPAVLITGTSRGLGLEFAKQYAKEEWDVHATARKPSVELQELAKTTPSVRLHELEVTDHAAVESLSAKLKDLALDVLINNAGIYGPSDDFQGYQQNLESMDYDLWRRVLETNTLAPYKVTQAFLPQLEKGKHKIVTMLSTEMASLQGMKESGMTSTCYQSSKAALNMAGISLAHELKPRGIAVLLLHPGWVKTDMGGQSAPLSAEDSVAGLRKVIAASGLRDTASYRDYAGRKLAW